MAQTRARVAVALHVRGEFGLEREEVFGHRVELRAAFGGEPVGFARGVGEPGEGVGAQAYGVPVGAVRLPRHLGQLRLEPGPFGLDDLGDPVPLVRRQLARCPGLGAGHGGPAPLHQRTAAVLTDAVDVHLAALHAVDVQDLAALAVGCLAPADPGEVGGRADALGGEGPDQAGADAVDLARAEPGGAQGGLDGLPAQHGEGEPLPAFALAVQAVQAPVQGPLPAQPPFVDALQRPGAGGLGAGAVPGLAVQPAAVGQLEGAAPVQDPAQGADRLDQPAAFGACLRGRLPVAPQGGALGQRVSLSRRGAGGPGPGAG